MWTRIKNTSKWSKWSKWSGFTRHTNQSTATAVVVAAAQPPSIRSSHSSPSLINFGIVAATDENGIIGINGRIPWTLPPDWANFEDLTRKKVLIVGRRTFRERNDFSHLAHLGGCIVVSSTIDDEQSIVDEVRGESSVAVGLEVRLARSLEEALDVYVCEHSNWSSSSSLVSKPSSPSSLGCWVGGGQRLYEEALQHKSAKEVWLTVIHTKAVTLPEDRVAYFPQRHLWEGTIPEVSELRRRGKDLRSNLSYTFYTHQRHSF